MHSLEPCYHLELLKKLNKWIGPQRHFSSSGFPSKTLGWEKKLHWRSRQMKKSAANLGRAGGVKLKMHHDLLQVCPVIFLLLERGFFLENWRMKFDLTGILFHFREEGLRKWLHHSLFSASVTVLREDAEEKNLWSDH